MLKFNQKLTALSLITVTSIAGTILTVTKASSTESDGCTNIVKTIELQDGRQNKVFCSDNNVSNLGKFGKKATSVSVQSGTWKFWSKPNFQGDSVTVSSDTFTRLGKLSNNVSSFRRISP
ncbi:beta/gamma crystallin-related protein [Scytonema sp. NUACC26]|uniref:beta/gamma crystallin-related protein n=1 Tax=Scytonema sp. NUACC26 TaxID=3140176 RepID=UPI0034DC7C24